MKYRALGATGLQISEIGMGCAHSAGLMTHGEPEDQLEAVRRALELGINHFDTAPNYRDGTSEVQLGRVLRELGAHPIVATKVEFWPDDLQDIPAKINTSFEGSLRRLGMDAVDILYLHNRIAQERRLTTSSSVSSLLALEDVMGPRGVLETFDRLRKAGQVRFLAFCAGGDAAATYQVLDSGAFDCVQVNYHLLHILEGSSDGAVGQAGPQPARFGADPRAQFIARAGELGVGVVAYGVLARASLTDQHEPHPLAHPGGGTVPTPADMERARSLATLAHERGQTLAQLAVRFPLTRPAVSSVLVGFSTLAHLEEAAVCSDLGGFSPEEVAALEAWLAQVRS